MLAKFAISQPIGSRHTSEIRPTWPIGMSCSVRGSSAALPAPRAREAAIAEARPLITGLTSLASVQIAATPMVPAPTKRTLWLQVAFARSAIEPATGIIAEKCGTPQPQPISAPTSIAMPTHSPTRCPMPNSANDRKKSNPVTPPCVPPTRKYCTTSPANTRVATTTANTADTIEPHSTASRPARLEAAAASALTPSLAPAPTLSTSAQATPSGYGRSELVTSARRSGIEYITPRMPPSAQIANEVQ